MYFALITMFLRGGAVLCLAQAQRKQQAVPVWSSLQRRNWDCLVGELELGNDSEEQVRFMFPIHSFCRRRVCCRVNGKNRRQRGSIEGMGLAVAEPHVLGQQLCGVWLTAVPVASVISSLSFISGGLSTQLEKWFHFHDSMCVGVKPPYFSWGSGLPNCLFQCLHAYLGFCLGLLQRPLFLIISELFRVFSSLPLNRDAGMHFPLCFPVFKHSALPITFWSHLLSQSFWVQFVTSQMPSKAEKFCELQDPFVSRVSFCMQSIPTRLGSERLFVRELVRTECWKAAERLFLTSLVLLTPPNPYLMTCCTWRDER